MAAAFRTRIQTKQVCGFCQRFFRCDVWRSNSFGQCCAARAKCVRSCKTCSSLFRIPPDIKGLLAAFHRTVRVVHHIFQELFMKSLASSSDYCCSPSHYSGIVHGIPLPRPVMFAVIHRIVGELFPKFAGNPPLCPAFSPAVWGFVAENYQICQILRVTCDTFVMQDSPLCCSSSRNSFRLTGIFRNISWNEGPFSGIFLKTN